MKKEKIILSLCLLFFFIITLFAISSHSLWIDESCTAYFASSNTINALFKELYLTKMSDLKAPGYMLYMFIWVKICGISELSLRLSNFPFFIVYLIMILYLPITNVNKKSIITFSCLNPFIWYYLNEARSYIIIFSLSGISLCGAILYIYNIDDNIDSKKSFRYILIILLSNLIGICFNMVFLLTIIPLLLSIILYLRNKKLQWNKVISQFWKAILYIFPFYLCIILYYLHTFTLGTGVREEKPGLFNIVFAIYEFIGFSGIGPPRNVIRLIKNSNNSDFLTLLRPYLINVIMYIIFLIIFTILIVWYLKKYNLLSYLYHPFLVSSLIALSFCYIFCYFLSLPFWGRHIIFIYPYLIFYISLIISLIIEKNKNNILLAGILVIFLYFFGISCYNLRFKDTYQKDNYKLAVAEIVNIKKIHNNPILWAGSTYPAIYYGLKIDNYKNIIYYNWKDIAINASNWSSKDIEKNINNNKAVLLVLFNKSDLFDQQKGWTNFLEKNNSDILFKHQDFIIYNINI